MVKTEWVKPYTADQCSKEFEFVFQSWDTANKCSELNDYSVCTTWGVANKHLYLIDVLRQRLSYPDLRRTVKQHAIRFRARNIIIEDKASGTQLIQDLREDGVYGTTQYQTKLDKVTRMNAVSVVIENGFVHVPVDAAWLPVFHHELAVFPNGKYDDQVDSVSQALDWWTRGNVELWYLEYVKELHLKSNGSGGTGGSPADNLIATDGIPFSEEKSHIQIGSAYQSPACERCGKTGLSYCRAQGTSGDILEECVCGWLRKTACTPAIRTALRSPIPTFEDDMF